MQTDPEYWYTVYFPLSKIRRKYMKRLAFILLLLLVIGGTRAEKQNTCKVYTGICTSNPYFLKIPVVLGADIVRGYLTVNMGDPVFRELPYTMHTKLGAADYDFVVGQDSVRFAVSVNGELATTPELFQRIFTVQVYKLNGDYSQVKL